MGGFTDLTGSLTRDGTIFWGADPAGWSPAAAVASWPSLYYVRASLSGGSYGTYPTESQVKTDILLFQYLGSLTAAGRRFVLAPSSSNTRYRSIGTRANYGTAGPEGSGTTVTATNGSTDVTGSAGTAWLTANRGRGDRIQIDGVDYTVLAVAAENRLELTEPYAGTSGSGKAYLIARKFASLAAWEDCIDGPGGAGCEGVSSASLVTDNRNEVGVAYRDTPFAAGLDVDGSTTDANHTITLTADHGNRHYGRAGAAGTVALIDNATTGAAIRVRDDHVTVEWLEIRGGSGTGAHGVEVSNLATVNNVVLDSLLIHQNPGSGIEILHPDAVADVYNNVIYLAGTGIRVNTTPSGTSRIRLLEQHRLRLHPEPGRHRVHGGEQRRRDPAQQHRPQQHDGLLRARPQRREQPQPERRHDRPRPQPRRRRPAGGLRRLDLRLHRDPRPPPAGRRPGRRRGRRPQRDLHGRRRRRHPHGHLGRRRRRAAGRRHGPHPHQGRRAGHGGAGRLRRLHDHGEEQRAHRGLQPEPGRRHCRPRSLAPSFSAPSRGTYNSGTGTWDLSALPLGVGETATIQLLATIDPAASGTLANTATVLPLQPPGLVDPLPQNNSATDTDDLASSADLALVHADAPDPVDLGGVLTYTLTVTNNGPSAATGVVLTDLLPAEMEFDAVAPSQGVCGFDGPTRTLTCDLGDLLPGAATVTLTVRPRGLGTFTATATVVRNEPDPVPVNDTAPATTTVQIPSLGVRFITVTSTTGQNVIEWLNPSSADYVSTEIVFRTDRFPTAPVEPGTTSLYTNAAADAKDSCPHTGLVDGQTYYYAAFVHRSAAPLVSPGRFVRGRPFDMTPPLPVKWAFSTGGFSVTPPTVGGAGIIATSNDLAVHAMARGPAGGEWPAGWLPVPGRRSRPVPLARRADHVRRREPRRVPRRPGRLRVRPRRVLGGSAALPPWPASLVSGGKVVQAAPAGIFTAFGGAYDYLLVGTRDATRRQRVRRPRPRHGRRRQLLRQRGPRLGDRDHQRDGGRRLRQREGLLHEPREGGGQLEHPVVPAAHRGADRLHELCRLDASRARRHRRQPGHPRRPDLRGKQRPGAGRSTRSTPRPAAADRSFVHGDGQVKGFVFPDRNSDDIYFATDNYVWGFTDTAALGLQEKYAGGISLGTGVRPSPVLFVPGSHYVYVGGSDGKLYEIDVAGAPVVKSVPLGDGLSVVGAPSLDRGFSPNLVHVGTEAGVFYAVAVPLP